MNKQDLITKLPPEPHEAMINRFGKEGAFIPGDDENNPWVPFGDQAAIKHLAFDIRQNSAANILWVKGTSTGVSSRPSRSRDRGATTNTTGSPGRGILSTNCRARRIRFIPTIRTE